MKRLLIIALGVLVLAGCSNASAEEKNTDDTLPVIEMKAVQVETLETREMIGNLTLPGQVEADEIQAVSAVVSGQINALHAEVGDMVEVGTLLVELDDEFVKLQKDQADIGNSLYNLSLETAKRSFERTKALYESGSTTQVNYDAAKDMLSKARLDYSRGTNSTSQINYQLKHMNVESPISGVVASKYQNVGASVAPGTPIYEIVNISEVIVEAGVTESDINRLSTGQVVFVNIPAIAGELEGVVDGIGPIPGNDGTYPVRVRIENSDGIVKPGMFAELKIETEMAKQVLSIPKIAVMHESGEDYVFVQIEGKAEKRVIQKGLAFGTYFEVVGGVEVGEEVVVSGQAYLDEGDALNVVK